MIHTFPCLKILSGYSTQKHVLTNTFQAQSRTHARPKLQPSVIITRPNITIHDIAQSTTVSEADEKFVFVLIKKSHISPSRASYGVSIVWILKQDRRWNAEKPSATLDP